MEESKNETSFQDLGVVNVLCEAVESLGWTCPTQIQEKSIPLALQVPFNT